MKDIIISREEFIEIINNIRAEEDKMDALKEGLDVICDGHFVVGTESFVLKSLLFLLNRVFFSDEYQSETLSWFLYEASASNEENRCMYFENKKLIVTTEILYDVLVAEASDDSSLTESIFNEYGIDCEPDNMPELR